MAGRPAAAGQHPLARNFLGAGAVSDRLFCSSSSGTSVPLLLFGLWFHIQRITATAVFPPGGG
ncbi:MAG: hypothetical protein IPM99_06780 [Rubrivivax sp.]|nr:hypothetical protein [Rubrivivax sp.]